MTSGAYYNEIDPYAAQWLRNLITAGHIAPGDVDERSILDVHPEDLKGYTQHHFFAGVSAWSLAFRRAGWDDARRVCSGSCPCQPFSGAGKGAGFADERHLWPAFYHLLLQLGHDDVFGEQVASPDGYAWLDLVQDDMEDADYAFGAVAAPSAGYGAPHGRPRIYWYARAMADMSRGGRGVERLTSEPGSERYVNGGDEPSRLGRHPGGRCERVGPESEHVQFMPASAYGRLVAGVGHGQFQEPFGRPQSGKGFGPVGAHDSYVSGVGQADAHNDRFSPSPIARLRDEKHNAESRSGAERPGPVNGLWRDADWLYCRDDRWRPVESSTFPLAHGIANRVGRLRAYGNSINVAQATGFILAAKEV